MVIFVQGFNLLYYFANTVARNKGADILFVIAVIFCFVITVLKAIAIVLLAIAIIVSVIFLIQILIETIYFNSKKFIAIKNKLQCNIEEYNKLYKHIEELKKSFIEYSAKDYGLSQYLDNSIYNFERPNFNQIQNNTPKEHYCSLSVCRNAQSQPFKYLCKYFYIPINESSLNKFEKIFNDFSSAEEGIRILNSERAEIENEYKKSIPFTIRMFRMDVFFRNLGYTPICNNDSHFPKYSFIYVSAGGNSSLTCDITLDMDNLDRFIKYLYNRIQLTKAINYQRSLMTKQLRNLIKERDNYTCQKCGISIKQEPHLLLEIDHIIPISKNGKTTIDNLQTLCWKCNRQKSNKLI